jgi:hypothetical protein
MRHTQPIFSSRLWAAVMGAGASLVLTVASLPGAAVAADQSATNAGGTTTQTASTPQTPEPLGPHTHQLHGVVKTAAASGTTTFTVTTERFGDVTVSFAGRTPKRHGHAHRRARAFEAANATDVKAGERVVIQGHTSADGKSFIARRVHVLPSKDAVARPTHLVGTISSVASANGGTSLTLKLADGTSQSFTVSSATTIRPEGKTVADLAVGTKVTVVTRNGAATGVVVLPG